MDQQRVDNIVSHLNFLIEEINHIKTLLTVEDGIHIYVIHEDAFTSIEIWDSECNEPRIVFHDNEKTPKDKLNRELEFALNQLGMRAHKKKIFWTSDFPWEELREGFKKLDEIYNIIKRDISDDVRKQIKGRINALYSMPK